MFNSIKWRLSAIFFMVTALFLFLLGLYLMNTIEQYSFNNIQNNLLSYARLMSDDLQASFAKPPSREFFQEYAKKVSHDINARVTFIDTSGEVLGDSVLDKDSMVNHANRPEVKKAINGEIGKSVRYSTSLEKRMFYFASPVKTGHQVLGVVRVAVPWDEIEASRNYIRKIIISSTLAALILMVMVSSAFTANLVVPLQEMTRVARDMAEGKMDVVINVTSDDEIGELGKGLNYMSVRLHDTISQITEERNKVKAILTSMTDGVIAIDRKGSILLINPAIEKLFHISHENSLGKGLIEVVRNFDLEKLLHQALESETGSTRELHLFVPDMKTFRISTAPLTNESGAVGAVAVLRDITAFRQVEIMKTDFVANVSHELKTPLTSIKGFVETLLDGALDEQETAKHFLEIINDETDRLNRLINDLLSLSRIEAKQRELNRVSLDLEKLINETVSILSPQASEKDLAINVNIKHPLQAVEADEDMIGQVLINLIDNAVKYTHQGGEVNISAETQKDQVKVAVSDTGIGIPIESIPRLFERFYRVDKARSREMGGTGLGLAIVKHILELHNGKIEVESIVGKGSMFTFYLPLTGASVVKDK